MVRHQPAKTYENQFGIEVNVVKHRAGWHATFSAPKSVSLTALVGSDERVREAHRESVRVALGELERYTQARLGNVNAPQLTGKFATQPMRAFIPRLRDTAQQVEARPGYSCANLTASNHSAFTRSWPLRSSLSFAACRRWRVLPLLACYGSFSPVQSQQTAPVDLLLKNATFMTVTHGTMEHSSVWVYNGKIAGFGEPSLRPQAPSLSMPRASSSPPASSIRTRILPSPMMSTRPPAL